MLFYKEVLENKDKLIPIINFIAQVDYNFSCSTLIDKLDSTEISYPIYLTNRTEPFLLLKNTYHPAIKNSNCIKNSIIFYNLWSY